jgi:hypothetical protein
MTRRLLPGIFVFCLLGCDGVPNNGGTTLPGKDAAAGATSLLAIVAGTLSTTFLTAKNEPAEKKSFFETVFSQLFGWAHATVEDCSLSVVTDTCSSGIKSGAYSGCTVLGTSKTFSEAVALIYSDSTCALTAAGQTVLRLTETARNMLPSEVYWTSTGTRTDYRGFSFGGGTQIEKTAGGWELNVLGFNKYARKSDKYDTHDVNIKSTANITMTDPTATSITFTGGSLEVVDTIKKYVATYVPTNVVINYSKCCYPQSGTFAVTYTEGSITGTATVTYTSSACGSAKLTVGTSSAAVPLWGCQ